MIIHSCHFVKVSLCILKRHSCWCFFTDRCRFFLFFFFFGDEKKREPSCFPTPGAVNGQREVWPTCQIWQVGQTSISPSEENALHIPSCDTPEAPPKHVKVKPPRKKRNSDVCSSSCWYFWEWIRIKWLSLFWTFYSFKFIGKHLVQVLFNNSQTGPCIDTPH